MLVARWYQSPAVLCGIAPGAGTAADNTIAPTIDDITPQIGETLTCNPGTWIGTAPINYNFQWFYWLADLDGVPLGAQIIGAILNTYELTDNPGSSDLGQKIFCRVIGSNVYGADTAYSNVVGPVNVGAGTPLAPTNFLAPDVTGSGVEGTDLLCADGSWVGTEPITYEYQWYYYIPIAPEEPTAPSSSTAPALTGSAYVGATLGCSSGIWAGTVPIAYHYQWKRGATNVGTDSSSYFVVPGDFGLTIGCTVTAVNSVGSASANSSNTKGPIIAAPPASVLVDEDGATLTAAGDSLTVTT